MVLQSEGFERAAYALVHALEKLQPIDSHELRQIANQFEESVQCMKRSVAVLAEIKAMDQANIARERQGHGPAYGEEHYFAVLEKL